MRGGWLLGSFLVIIGCTGDGGGSTSEGTVSSSDSTTTDTSGGSTGGSGGSASGTGSSASGSAATGASDSASGTGGEGPPVVCMAGAVPGSGEVDPEVKKDVMGDDGTVQDHCDRDGNLVEGSCETQTECGPGPNPECTTTQTGNTTTEVFDCNGMCVDGTCVARCPDYGDEVEYLQTGDPATIRNNEDGRIYSCLLVFDQMNDTYDCAADPAVGEVTTVEALGLGGTFCTGGEFGNIQTATGCSYTCTLQ